MEGFRSAFLIRVSPTILLHTFRVHWDILVLPGILCLALVLRVVELGSVPRNVTADEMDNLQTVYHILEGTGPFIFGFDWKPSPAYGTYIMATMVGLFGDDVAALRLGSALHSVFALIPFYLLARQVVSRPAALMATVLMSTSLWYLHFSRSGWENIYGAFYGAAAALCLSLAVRSRSRLFYGLCGFFCALGLFVYYASTFIIAGFVAYLPFALLLHREQRKQILLGYGIVLAVALLVFAPQLV
ncbi:MAG: glycosyltransferase family 39 protein, partial [Chloroflexota bacterium]